MVTVCFSFFIHSEIIVRKPSYVEKLDELDVHVLTFIKRNRKRIEPFNDTVQESYEKFLHDHVNLHCDPSGQHKKKREQMLMKSNLMKKWATQK